MREREVERKLAIIIGIDRIWRSCHLIDIIVIIGNNNSLVYLTEQCIKQSVYFTFISDTVIYWKLKHLVIIKKSLPKN